jgi:WD40 repeat protein
MSLCINPSCQNILNPDNILYCQSCGSELLLEGCYRVIRPMGKGGFAKTFEVNDDSEVTKILKVLTENTAKAVSLFKQEAEILKRFNHPGIPNAEDSFEFFPHNSQQPVYCLVMEKIEGENLQEYLQQRNNRPINEKQAFLWLKNLATILHEVHQQNLFHRDIKPSNIMRRTNGQLVLIDFGIAREVSETYEKKQAEGQITKVLTDGYAPREQDLGQAVPQSDFFALGRTFVHLLTGKYPVDLMDDRYGDPCTMINWREHASNISPIFADFIDNLMSPAIKNRPANTQAILDKLAEIDNILYPPKVTTLQLSSSEIVEKNTNITLAYTLGGWLKGHLDVVYCVAISPDGKTLISSSKDKTIRLWKIDSGEEILTINDDANVYSIAISPDGKTLISASDKKIKIWNLMTGELIDALSGHDATVLSVAISNDGKILASGSADKTIKVWNLETLKEIKSFTENNNSVTSVIFSSKNQRLFSGCRDGKVKFFPPGRTLIDGGNISSIAVSIDEQFIVCGDYSPPIFGCSIQVLNLNSNKLRKSSEVSEPVTSVAISPNNKFFVSGGENGTIQLWDLETCKIISIREHIDSVTSLAISMDGKMMASSSYDGTIKVWRID